MLPISQSVCQWQAFSTQHNVTFQLIGLVLRLQRKLSVVNMAPGSLISGAIFTTLHLLFTLQRVPISQSVCQWQAFSTKHYVTFQLIGLILKLRCLVNMVLAYYSLLVCRLVLFFVEIVVDYQDLACQSQSQSLLVLQLSPLNRKTLGKEKIRFRRGIKKTFYDYLKIIL